MTEHLCHPLVSVIDRVTLGPGSISEGFQAWCFYYFGVIVCQHLKCAWYYCKFFLHYFSTWNALLLFSHPCSAFDWRGSSGYLVSQRDLAGRHLLSGCPPTVDFSPSLPGEARLAPSLISFRRLAKVELLWSAFLRCYSVFLLWGWGIL